MRVPDRGIIIFSLISRLISDDKTRTTQILSSSSKQAMAADNSTHLKPGDFNCPAPTWLQCAWRSWTMGPVIGIEVMVVLAAVNLLFLATFGSRRRRSRNFFIQKGLLGAYALSSSLVSYTLGLMQSSTMKSNMFPIWAISLFILFNCTNSITAYSLDDNNQCMRLFFQGLLDCLYVSSIIGSSKDSPVTLLYLYSIGQYYFTYRMLVFRLATKSWNLNKIVADYMYEEHTKSGSSYNPVTLKGYHYLVTWPLHKSILEAQTSYATMLTADATQIIDIEQIWLCNGRSLSPQLKDACLSFALSQLLRRRFFGFACVESSQQKTDDFVFKGLLARTENGTIDYNRVFKVIDIELAFIYDFFFTRYAALYYGSKESTFWSLAVAVLMLITAFIVREPKFSNLDIDVVVNSGIKCATHVITVLILVSVILLELLQLLLYWMTIWGRVSFVCQYIRERESVNKMRSCCMKFKEIVTKIGVAASNKYCYRDKLGQYSLVESVSQDLCPSMAEVDVPQRPSCFCFLFWSPIFLDKSAFMHNMNQYAARFRKRRPGKSIKVPTEVKEALVYSLERTDGKLTNGESSLVWNGAYQLLWACSFDAHSVLGTRCSLEKENQSHVILTWHVATCYCEMATLKYMSIRVGGMLKFNFDVATKLSKYCAYLVVTAPKLLPGHHYDTSCMFDALAAEAAQLLSGDKYEAMRSLPEPSPADMTIFPMGVKLGKQLEEMEEVVTCWKVLADFWAEMLLYLAPSDNVKEHIERLANGGEFLTHLWALLSHAGILTREQRNANDIENAGADRSYVAEESHSDVSLRFRRATSHPLTCAEKRSVFATSSTNQPATSGRNYSQSLEISIEGARTAASGQGSGNE